MRIFEKLVCKQELSPTLKLQIRSDQFAYKKGHNTTMVLLKCQHYWSKWLDRHADFVRVFSFDFRKVLHEIVCNKLKLYNINPYVINWIISFLIEKELL